MHQTTSEGAPRRLAEPVANPAADPAAGRVRSLDALRGLAILLMCLSGVVPWGLAAWMHHAQYIRPEGVALADWPGFTWVDLVFPMFLFAMGAAFPIALSRRLERHGLRATLGWVAWRAVALIGFAVYVQQIHPGMFKAQGETAKWLLCLAGFFPLFAVFTRLPGGWRREAVWATRAGGVALCVGYVCYLNTLEGRAFAWQNDIIILLLAHASWLGSVIWLATRGRVWLRLLTLGAFFVAHHQAMQPRWRLFGGALDWVDPILNAPKRLLDLRWVTDAVPEGWLNLGVLYDFTWFKFMWVVIPGTVAGDLLMRGVRGGAAGEERRPAAAAVVGLAVAAALAVVAVHVGLQNHGREFLGAGWLFTTPYAAATVGLPLLAATGWLAWRLRGGAGLGAMPAVALHGCGWLAVGLALSVLPAAVDGGVFEGGIKKGPPATLSYYTVATGLSLLLLAVLGLWLDRPGRQTRAGAAAASLLVANGQNPMLAYVAIRNLLAPLVSLPVLAWLGSDGAASLDAAAFGLSDRAWVDFGWSVAKTLLLAVAVWGLTRRGLVWRT